MKRIITIAALLLAVGAAAAQASQPSRYSSHCQRRLDRL
jgi:hypothetical protein